MTLADDLREQMLAHQRGEITESVIYKRLAAEATSAQNRRILEDIAGDELRHYQAWRSHTQQDVKPDRLGVFFHYWISRIFGLTFGLKWMERQERRAQAKYKLLSAQISEAQEIIADESKHEAELLQLLDEERLRYVGSIVLGLNDALVELTGGLAGLTFALRSARLVALSGLIVGLAAALSMAASGYLSTKAEKGEKAPLKSAVYTGATYVVTVILLVLPYLVLGNPYVALACTLIAAMLIVAAFNYYISVARDESFRRLFLEMAGVCLGVSALSFAIGYAARALLGIEV